MTYLASARDGTIPSSQADWPDAVVVGLELNGLGLARALWRRGIRVVGVGLTTDIAHLSRAVAVTSRLQAWNEQALIDRLSQLGRGFKRPPVLFQTKDEGVLWTSKHQDRLEEWYRIPIPPPTTVDRLMNKGVFTALARKEGWSLPATWAATSEAELRALIPELPFPCILKPQLKNSVFRRQNTPKAFRPANPGELLETYRLVAQWEPEVVIAEWIEGRDDQLVSCRGYWDRDGNPVMRFVARKLLQWPVELGNMAVVEAAPPEWWGDCKQLTQQVFDRTGMFGVGAMEYKRRPDGRLAILEPCVGRTVYSHEVAPLNGFDIPWACYCDQAFGVRVAEPEAVVERLKLVDGPRAHQSMAEYRARGSYSPHELDDLVRGPGCDMTWRWRDPAPQLVAWKRQARSAAARLRRRFAPG